MSDTKTKSDKAAETGGPQTETVQPEEEPKPIPAKGDDGYDTPSGYAIAKVGDNPHEAGTDEAKEHGEKYLAEKSKKRWGYA